MYVWLSARDTRKSWGAAWRSREWVAVERLWRWNLEGWLRRAEMPVCRVWRNRTIVKVRTKRPSWTELNWHGLVFDELANGQAGRAHWLLVDAYVSIVTYRSSTPFTLLAHWSFVKKQNISAQLSLVSSLCSMRLYWRQQQEVL